MQDKSQILFDSAIERTTRRNFIKPKHQAITFVYVSHNIEKMDDNQEGNI